MCATTARLRPAYFQRDPVAGTCTRVSDTVVQIHVLIFISWIFLGMLVVSFVVCKMGIETEVFISLV